MGYYYRSMYGYPSKTYYLYNKYKKEFPNLSEDELAEKLSDNLSESDREEDIIMQEKSINDLKTGIKNCKDETDKSILKSRVEFQEYFLGIDKMVKGLREWGKRLEELIEEESNLK